MLFSFRVHDFSCYAPHDSLCKKISPRLVSTEFFLETSKKRVKDCLWKRHWTFFEKLILHFRVLCQQNGWRNRISNKKNAKHFCVIQNIDSILNNTYNFTGKKLYNRRYTMPFLSVKNPEILKNFVLQSRVAVNKNVVF